MPPWLPRLHQAGFVGHHDQLGPVAGAELGQQPPDVSLGSGHRDVQSLRDLGVGQPPPAGGALAGLLSRQGGAVSAETDGGLAVTGLDAAAIGELARAHGITLHELTPRHASLEEAFMELTRDSVDYRADLTDDTRKAA